MLKHPVSPAAASTGTLRDAKEPGHEGPHELVAPFRGCQAGHGPVTQLTVWVLSIYISRQHCKVGLAVQALLHYNWYY